MKIAQQFTAGIGVVAREESVKRTVELIDNEFSRPLRGLRVCIGMVIPPMNRGLFSDIRSRGLTLRALAGHHPFVDVAFCNINTLNFTDE